MTLEEKAKEYTESIDTRVFGCDEILDATDLMKQSYVAGATEALASQWKDPKVELPETDEEVVVLTAKMRYPTPHIAYYDGNEWRTTDGEHIRPVLWMRIPPVKGGESNDC